MKIGHSNRPIVGHSNTDLPKVHDVNMEVAEEDEEGEGVDLNPFPRGDTHSEASSSMSSENEGPGDKVEINLRSSLDGVDASVSSRHSEEPKDCEVEETAMRTTVHEGDGYSGILMEKELTPFIQRGEGLACIEKSTNEFFPRSGSEGAACLASDGTNQRPILEIDDGDAICRRTRARHSLANYRLEELETFFEESDDDVDLPNVDEEEYHKFLAAVLVEEADDGNDGQDDNVDEDEENDTDFELEIDEALESDADDIEALESDADEIEDSERGQSGKQDGKVHMPVTRQKKCLKESAKNKKTFMGQAKIPLQPSLPYESNAQIRAFNKYGWQFSLPKYSTSSFGSVIATGFAAHQVGQLYCLIHEHVQFLIQVFSICILDPSRQEVASEIEKMITEMIYSREEALGWRKVPYPGFCFHPPNLHSSRQFGFGQAANYPYWTPSIDSPVLSILDVAPLRLARSFLTDVSDTALRYRQSYTGSVTIKSHFTKEPLFPLPMLESSNDTNKDASSSSQIMHLNTRINGTKQQLVALVPKDIARSVKRFYHLFNSALFPHNSPSQSVANHVLFTEAEDRLLAMGLMEYNNDWAAIQKRFLPCKSEHQIFVRKKNRSSSKAPENPIKAAWHMKKSPLPAHEVARIYEGLKLFNNDWSLVWKFIVPHRDPSLLPRQWRIANDSQKSYKKSETLKMKRRLHDRENKRMKPSVYGCQTSAELEVDIRADNNTGDIDGEDEAYVHEAFLAEPVPKSSGYGVCLKDLSANPVSRASTGHLVSRLHQTHKRNGARAVKLAPDLPAVNLPPSVRIFSQPSFEKNHSEPSSSKFVYTAKKSHAPISAQAANIGCVLDRGDHLKKLSNNVSDAGCLEDGATCTSQFGEEDNTSQIDLQMHPLLFQAPEIKLPSYLTDSPHSSRSGIYNFFPRDQFQTDLNLWRQHVLISPGACSSETQNPDKAQSDLSTLEFHPLLQRVEKGTDPSQTPSLHRLSADLETPQGNCSQYFGQFDCTQRILQVATSRASPSHDGKQNNLDLDIHLSSAPENGKTSGRYINERHDEGDLPDLKHMMLEKYQHGGGAFVNCNELLPSNNGACQCKEGLHDESMAGIVMEQEELSDSEEDIEQLDFECEEIDDSEGDEMVDEQLSGIQNKEFPFFTSKEKEKQASEPLQTRHLKKGSTAKGEKCTISVQASQNVCSAEILCSKPKLDGAKRNRSRRNPSDELKTQRGQSSEKQSSNRSKVIRSQTTQCKAAAATASRKPRK